MSYIWDRDRLPLEPGTQDMVDNLADWLVTDARRAFHRDECNCVKSDCQAADFYEPRADEVLADLLNRGLLDLGAVAQYLKGE